ncbi:uncharacterized protein LOC110161204 [Boleophthalmus pectinirostris]|uniref:uncharacterized protein LOC110161204 n=1 Tax=Boleophthalmus pectinirostris TaxID=150288 RepID=UPI002432F245|nr:uncharacterized protein LOC110161204 [Boleophthalmus pectinirostris]
MAFLLLCLLQIWSSVIAEGEVRLVSSGSVARCSGRVEVFLHGEWGTVCDDGWKMLSAEVVCRQLDCGTAVDFLYGAWFGEGTGHIWLKEVKCLGGESALTHCPHRLDVQNCKHNEDAGVICMKPPEIFAEISWGQISVTCSMPSAFTGGLMVLLDHSNKTLQTSKSNPATFTFPRGAYDKDTVFKCLYQEHILKVYTSTPSASVTAVPRVPKPVVVPSAAGGALLLLVLLIVVVVVYRRRSTRQICVGCRKVQVQDDYENVYEIMKKADKVVRAGRAEVHDEARYSNRVIENDDDDYENAGYEEGHEEGFVGAGSRLGDHDEVRCSNADSPSGIEYYGNISQELEDGFYGNC